MRHKKEKLVIISPLGREYEIGFLSHSKDGLVLGTSQIKGVDTSHLTIVNKKGIISSQITLQYQGDRQYFPPITKKEIIRRFRSITENKLFSQLPQ